jgi:hypothetical protein
MSALTKREREEIEMDLAILRDGLNGALNGTARVIHWERRGEWIARTMREILRLEGLLAR